MIPITEYAGRDVAVYGLGRTGLSAAKALKAGGARVHAWDDNEETRAKAEAAGIALSDINKRDWQTYWELYENVAAALKPPDLMIYLRCPVKTLKQRIRLRGRKMEQDIPTGYLNRLNALYEDWFTRYNMSPVLVLPTDTLDYLTNLVDRVDLFRQIEKHL